jgi:hypothetical protein
MTRSAISLAAVGLGVLLFVAGIYGWVGDDSIFLAGAALVISLMGVVGLLSTQSRTQLRRPHAAVYVLLIVAAAFHVFQNLRMMSVNFAFGWFLWALLPYGLVLALSFFEGTRRAVTAGAVLALAFDAWSLYEVARSTSSTAALAFVWIPLWNTMIVVPMATFLTWLVMRRRQTVLTNAP